MTIQVTNAGLMTGTAITAQMLKDQDDARIRVEKAEDKRLTGLPSSWSIQIEHSIPELNLTANCCQFFSKERWETQWAVYAIRREPFSAHMVGIFGPRGFRRLPNEMKHLRPSAEPGLPPEIATRHTLSHYGECLEVVTEYIETFITGVRPYHANTWL
jgi:hypothetical protein